MAHKLSAVLQRQLEKKAPSLMASGVVDGRPVVGEDDDSGGVAGAVGHVQGPDWTHHVQVAGCHSLLALRDPTKLMTDENVLSGAKERRHERLV